MLLQAHELNAAFAVIAIALLAGCNRTAEPDPAQPAATVGSSPQVEVPGAVPEDAGTDSALVATATVDASDGSCNVRVIAVPEAKVYRGPGVDSPQRQETFRNLPPKTAERWRGRDHALMHLSCTYLIRLNGATYRYRYTAKQSLGRGDDLDPAQCSTDETRVKVEMHISKFTKQCTKLRAGEYWGDRLDPVQPGQAP